MAITEQKQTFEWQPKDPDELLNRTHNWALRLENGETITSVSAEVDPPGEGEEPSGVIIENGGTTLTNGTVQMVKLSGGDPGTNCKLTLRAEIDGGPPNGQSFDVGIKFKVKDW